jgi:hypothetical protein
MFWIIHDHHSLSQAYSSDLFPVRQILVCIYVSSDPFLWREVGKNFGILRAIGQYLPAINHPQGHYSEKFSIYRCAGRSTAEIALVTK